MHYNAMVVSQKVSNYQIGSHQILDKWLKGHKGETFTIDTFAHIENTEKY